MAFRRLIVFTILTTLVGTLIGPIPQAHAQGAVDLPVPGTMLSTSVVYAPVLMKGLKVHADQPFKFDFIMDTGHSGLTAQDQDLKAESNRLIKYFLAALTLPEKDLWVNLSPYEKDRMIADNLGQTEMGRDMLAQDYILKQLTASLIYPEKGLGKTFWDKVYTKAQQLYGTNQIPVNTFNKVWIVADRADVFERNNTAYVVGAHLKVMLEEDYTALNKGTKTTSADQSHTVASQVVREIILPELEKEVNEGKNFAPLRQMFYSMILASWYKTALKDAVLTQVYGDQSKVKVGINAADPAEKQKIYERYIQAYKKGVFNYIKDQEPANVGSGTTVLPRKYFSGGESMAMLRQVVKRLDQLPANSAQLATGNMVEVSGPMVIQNAAMIAAPQGESNYQWDAFSELVLRKGTGGVNGDARVAGVSSIKIIRRASQLFLEGVRLTDGEQLTILSGTMKKYVPLVTITDERVHSYRLKMIVQAEGKRVVFEKGKAEIVMRPGTIDMTLVSPTPGVLNYQLSLKKMPEKKFELDSVPIVRNHTFLVGYKDEKDRIAVISVAWTGEKLEVTKSSDDAMTSTQEFALWRFFDYLYTHHEDKLASIHALLNGSGNHRAFLVTWRQQMQSIEHQFAVDADIFVPGIEYPVLTAVAQQFLHKYWPQPLPLTGNLPDLKPLNIDPPSAAFNIKNLEMDQFVTLKISEGEQISLRWTDENSHKQEALLQNLQEGKSGFQLITYDGDIYLPFKKRVNLPPADLYIQENGVITIHNAYWKFLSITNVSQKVIKLKQAVSAKDYGEERKVVDLGRSIYRPEEARRLVLREGENPITIVRKNGTLVLGGVDLKNNDVIFIHKDDERLTASQLINDTAEYIREHGLGERFGEIAVPILAGYVFNIKYQDDAGKRVTIGISIVDDRLQINKIIDQAMVVDKLTAVDPGDFKGVHDLRKYSIESGRNTIKVRFAADALGGLGITVEVDHPDLKGKKYQKTFLIKPERSADLKAIIDLVKRVAEKSEPLIVAYNNWWGNANDQEMTTAILNHIQSLDAAMNAQQDEGQRNSRDVGLAYELIINEYLYGSGERLARLHKFQTNLDKVNAFWLKDKGYTPQEIRKVFSDILNEVSVGLNIQEVKAEFDRAMALSLDVAQETKGGIDLNRDRMQMNVSKEGAGVQVQFDPRMIEGLKKDGFDGLEFHIETITPITNLPFLLGLREDELNTSLAKA